MKKWRIEYSQERKYSPISWWVHKDLERTSKSTWCDSVRYEPEFPQRTALKGFPSLIVTVGRFELEFSSSHEVRHCIEILEYKHLPSTKDLICKHSTAYQSYNHWLATYPAKLKSWKKRQQIVSLLKNTLAGLNQADINF